MWNDCLNVLNPYDATIVRKNKPNWICRWMRHLFG